MSATERQDGLEQIGELASGSLGEFFGAMAFDADRLAVSGAPVPVLGNVAISFSLYAQFE